MYDFEQYALLCGAFFTCFLKKRMIENKIPQLLFGKNKKTLSACCVKVFWCRKSGSNRYDVSIEGF